MANFNLSTLKSSGKDFMKNVQAPAMMGGLIAAGAIGSQKFLDLKTWMKDAPPDAFYIKHQGAIKAGAGIVSLAMWKGAPDWAKWLIMGVIIQGIIQEARQLTSGSDLELPSIGAGDEDSIMREATQALMDGKMNGITNDYSSQVMGITDDYTSAVAGMGATWGNNW